MSNENRSIRNVIGENLSLSKFAKCIGVSRPTLYKYMDAYDSKLLDTIPDSVLNIFDDVSSETDRIVLKSFFDGLYTNYLRTEERREHDGPVPRDIADIIDEEDLDVDDIDRMIGIAQEHLEWLLKKNPQDEAKIENVRKDILDLEYTKDMVQRRRSEKRFTLIYSASWTSCIGPGVSDVIAYNEEAESDIPGIESRFRFFMTRADPGYTLFFYNDEEGDDVEVQLLTGSCDDRTKDIMGTFRPGLC